MKELKVKKNMVSIDESNPYMTRKVRDMDEVTNYNYNNTERQEYIEWLEYEIKVYEHRIGISKRFIEKYESTPEAWRDTYYSNDYFSVKKACTDYEECLTMLRQKLSWLTEPRPTYVED